MSFVVYLLEVSLCIAMVFLIFTLFMKRTTFFQLNRFFLIGGLIVAILLPLISLPQHFATESTVLSQLSFEKIETRYVPLSFEEGYEANAFETTFLLTSLYISGVLLFGVRFLASVFKLLRLGIKSTKTQVQGIDICVQERMPVFSFCNFIFAPSTVDPSVLRHERVHIVQLHWLDNFFVELVAIALWFNPLMWFYKRAIKEQHEYLADSGAIEGEADVSAYMLCLLNTSYSHNGLAVASHFGSNTIKNRIIMLTKNKTPRYKMMFYLLLAPVAALLLVAFQESTIVPGKSVTPRVIGTQNVPDGAPIEPGKIKSTIGFGERLHPATSKMVKHTGVDLVADEGVDVVATADGVVVETTFNDLKGNFVVIRHNDQFRTQYFHLLKSTVTKGSAIKKGDVIGMVGSTGVLSTSNHLHYEVLKDGEAVDPISYLPQGYIK